MIRNRSQARPPRIPVSLMLCVGLFGVSAIEASLPAPGTVRAYTVRASAELLETSTAKAVEAAEIVAASPTQQVLARDLRIRWQAKVRDGGGEFVLYSLDSHGYEVVAQRAPGSGPVGAFEVTDSWVRSGVKTYQLRFRDSEGLETVLMSASVELEEIEPLPYGGSGTAAGTALVLSDLAAEFEPPAVDRLAREHSSRAPQWARQPLSPPPRALSTG